MLGMVWLGVVLSVAVFIAILRGGRITNLGKIKLRLWWLLVVGFLVQAASNWLPTDRSWSSAWGTGLVLFSYLFILAVITRNRDRPGMWLSGFGILMNFTVIAFNGGMPVMAEAAFIASGFEVIPQIADYKHVLLNETTQLVFLADVIPIRLIQGNVVSLGDIFLAVGMGRFIESELRRPVLWFKHSAHRESGSASRAG
jgi:hypothetical protein